MIFSYLFSIVVTDVLENEDYKEHRH